MSVYGYESLSPEFINSLDSSTLNMYFEPYFKSNPRRMIGTCYFPLPIDSYLLGVLFILIANYFSSNGRGGGGGIGSRGRSTPEMGGWTRWKERWGPGIFVGWIGLMATAMTAQTWAWALRSVSVGPPSLAELAYGYIGSRSVLRAVRNGTSCMALDHCDR